MDRAILLREAEIWRESDLRSVTFCALWNGYGDEGATRSAAIDNLAAQIDRQRVRRERGES